MSYYSRRRSTGSGASLLIIIPLLILALFLGSMETSDQEEQITQVIQQHGGQIVEIDQRSWNVGPFNWSKSKYDEVYKVLYDVNGTKKEAWVMFDDGFFSDTLKWNWDYVED